MVNAVLDEREVDQTTATTKVAETRGILGFVALICCIVYSAAGAKSPMGRLRATDGKTSAGR